jgi:hypothetical protein
MAKRNTVRLDNLRGQAKERAKVEVALQAAMKKPRGQRTETERVLVRFGRLLNDLGRFERSSGREEDKLGLPRSKATDPWDDRFRRIHEL